MWHTDRHLTSLLPADVSYEEYIGRLQYSLTDPEQTEYSNDDDDGGEMRSMLLTTASNRTDYGSVVVDEQIAVLKRSPAC